MVRKEKDLARIAAADGRKPTGSPACGQAAGGPAAINPFARAVVSITAARAGTSELVLECGHVLRRRLALCPPRRVICPSCRGRP